MAVSDLQEAMRNTRDMDCYLEARSAQEVIQDISEAISRAADTKSLRDYFAGCALSAIVSATSASQHQPVKPGESLNIDEAMARDAYVLASAMLAERERAK